MAGGGTRKGIHEDDREIVFTKFSQANASMEGAGLGLAISKELAVLMSGDVFLKETKVGENRPSRFVSQRRSIRTQRTG